MKEHRYHQVDGCQACDLCGTSEPVLVLVSNRLDGPLVRCSGCLLYYVANGNMNGGESRKVDGDAGREMQRLAERAHELGLVDTNVEESERPWREQAACERLLDLHRFVTGGRLLEVGCSTGELLAAATGLFEAFGVEANLESSLVASGRGLHCVHGTLVDASFANDRFDVAALYHTIEHLPSPFKTLLELRRVIRPGGWLVVETPNIATIWFRLLGRRWRQLIPDHLYFFTPETIGRLCRETGFEIRELRTVGKAMSVRLFASRLGRYHKSLGESFSRLSRVMALENRTLRLNLGDVMRMYAVKR